MYFYIVSSFLFEDRNYFVMLGGFCPLELYGKTLHSLELILTAAHLLVISNLFFIYAELSMLLLSFILMRHSSNCDISGREICSHYCLCHSKSPERVCY